MSFPTTRHTLIQRLAQGGDEADWRDFLRDYWGAVCRFAQRVGRLSWDDAEDVASQTLEAMLEGQLLRRWHETRAAKLRTLICSVVKNVLANRYRVESGRQRLIEEHGGQLDRYLEFGEAGSGPARELDDAFYAAWADSMLQMAVDDLLTEYNESGRGDYFRVLYGRICEELTVIEVADSLQISVASVDNYYRHARKRLGERLHEVIQRHVQCSVPSREAAAEIQEEWERLGTYIEQHGGLEPAIRNANLSSAS